MDYVESKNNGARIMRSVDSVSGGMWYESYLIIHNLCRKSSPCGIDISTCAGK